MELGRKIWILMAVAVLIAVVVLLVVFLPSASTPGGTVTPTPSPTPVVWPTPTATGIGYPTPTATGVGYPTPTQTPCVRSLTVNQADSCCDVKVVRNETIHYDVLHGHQMIFINIPCGEVIPVNASFNGSCNTWNGWIGSVDNAGAMNTTVTMDSDKAITASCVAEATPTATGIGYPTPTPTVSPTPTGIGYPTPTPTVSPTATGIGSPTPTPTPTETAFIFWNQSSITVSINSNFSLAVNVTNVKYLTASQFDVIYNPSVLNVRSPYPGVAGTVGEINDALDRSAYGDPSGGCGWQSVGPLSYGPIDIGYGNAPTSSGCLRILLIDEWAQGSSDGEGGCQGGDGTGQCGDGWITVIRFRAIGPGTSEIAFAGKKQINQIVDWVPKENYSYSGVDVVWGPNVRVTVQ